MRQMYFKLALLLILIFSINQGTEAQPSIEGQIVIDTTIWRPIAYLSIIPDLDNINTMAYDMIIDQFAGGTVIVNKR